MDKPKKSLKNRPIPLRLQEHRDRLGWSQMRLAEEMGSSNATVNRIENGEQNWNQEFLQDAARALGVEIVDLLPPDLVAADPSLAEFLSMPPADRARAVRLAKVV